MNGKLVRGGRIIAVALGVATSASVFAAGRNCGGNTVSPLAESSAFRLFDATLYRGKPDLSAFGVEPIVVHYGEMWKGPDHYQEVPEDATIATLAAAHPTGGAPIVLDVEMWPVRGVPSDQIDGSIEKLRLLLSRFKAHAAPRPIGLYSLLPLRDYWRAVKGPTSAGYQAWQSETDRVAVLEREVSVLFPSIYTFYDDQDGWRKYAISQISEARRISRKPVYAFLWPEYHDSNKQLGGTFIDARFWRLQLDLMCALADGVVIWGGYDTGARKPRQWDEDAPWWRETKDFIAQLRMVRK